MINIIRNLFKKEYKCPYCGIIFEKKPTRKTKCEKCQQFVYVSCGKLITKDQRNLLDLKRKLEPFGISGSDIESMRSKLKIRFNQNPSYDDVTWGLFNQLIIKYRNDFQTLKMIYYEMALFLNKKGKNPNKLLQLSNKMELSHLKQQGFSSQVEILASKNSCENCQRMSGKSYSIDEAIKKMPLPNKNCSFKLENGKYPFCRCLYLSK